MAKVLKGIIFAREDYIHELYLWMLLFNIFPMFSITVINEDDIRACSEDAQGIIHDDIPTGGMVNDADWVPGAGGWLEALVSRPEVHNFNVDGHSVSLLLV